MRAKCLLVLALVSTLLFLVGCVRTDSNLTVNANDTVSGTISVGLNVEVLETLGSGFGDTQGRDFAAETLVQAQESVQELNADFAADTRAEYNFQASVLQDGKYTGVKVTFENVPFAEWNSTVGKTTKSATAGEAGDQLGSQGASALNLTFTRSGDTQTVTGTLGSQADPESTAMLGALAVAEGFTPTQSLTLTFAGEVTQTNGALTGSTVTWTGPAGEEVPVNVTASTSSGSAWPWVVFAVAAVVLVVVGVAFAVTRRRKDAAGRAAAPESSSPELVFGVGAPPVPTAHDHARAAQHPNTWLSITDPNWTPDASGSGPEVLGAYWVDDTGTITGVWQANRNRAGGAT